MSDFPSPSPSGAPSPSETGPSPSSETTPAPKTTRRGGASRGRSSARGSGRKKAAGKKTTAGRKTSRSRTGSTPPPRSSSPDPEPARERPTVDTKQVKVALEETGKILNQAGCAIAGVYPEDWPEIFTFTRQDLDELAEPLARIANKHIAAAQLVGASDEIIVSLKLGRWAVEGIQATFAARRYAEVERDPGEPDNDREERHGAIPAQVVEVPRGGGGGPHGGPQDRENDGAGGA